MMEARAHGMSQSYYHVISPSLNMYRYTMRCMPCLESCGHQVHPDCFYRYRNSVLGGGSEQVAQRQGSSLIACSIPVLVTTSNA